MNTEKKKIGELLVDAGYVTPAQVAEALDVQKKKHDRICSTLIDLGYLTDDDFLEFLASIPGTASVNLSSCEIDQDLLDLVPADLAKELEVVPIGKIGNLLTVGMVCPLDEAGQKKLEDTTGFIVKPVLCSKNAVQRAFDRYYEEPEPLEYEDQEEPAAAESGQAASVDMETLKGPLQLRRIAQLVEEIEELPTLPDVLNLISAIVNDPDSSADDLAKVVASDSALSAKILKLANSAAYGFSREISSIKHAISMLGFRETQALAISVSVFNNLVDVQRFDFNSYWNHSFACGTVSRLISLNLPEKKMENAFVAGLLHDIGKVVIAMSMRGKQERMNSLSSSSDITPLEAEEKVLGITHAEVGYLLGERWRLPAPLVNAIRFHHLPELEPAPKGLGNVVFLGDRFCSVQPPQKIMETSFDERVLDALKTLEMPENSLIKALDAYSTIASDITVFS